MSYKHNMRLSGVIELVFIACVMRIDLGTQNGAESLKTFHTPDYYAVDSMQCEKVTIPACRRLGYNDTRIPRFMYLENIRQGDVIEYLRLFENEFCEREMLFFLCTIFNPVCFKNYKGHIFPCRSVCEDVKRKCKSVINKFGDKWSRDWSSVFKCNNLPEYKTDICIKPKSIVSKKYFLFNIEEQVKTSNAMKCENCPHPRVFKRYKQFVRCDYAIDVQFLSKTTAPDGKTKLQFKLYKSFKSGSTRLRRFDTIELWSDLPCLCPEIHYDKRYIILGREAKSGWAANHMVYDSRTIVAPKTEHLKKKLAQCKKEYRKAKRERKLGGCHNSKNGLNSSRKSRNCVDNKVSKRQKGPHNLAISYLMKFVRFNMKRNGH